MKVLNRYDSIFVFLSKPYFGKSVTLFVLGFFLTSCEYNSADWQKKHKIVATTGMIGDALKNILPANFSIHVLMGAGVDPHMFEAKPRDIDQLAMAETIVYNGLHLEGKMVSLFSKLKLDKNVFAISNGLPKNKILKASAFSHDPHIWLDPFLWAVGIDHLGHNLAKVYPEFAKQILHNTRLYSLEINQMGEWMMAKFATIPKKQRILITSHDAFNYFGKAFGIKVDALQGVSTLSEPGIRTVDALMKTIIEHKVPSVFVESSVSKKSIQALKEVCARKDYTLKEGGTLFSDAMGDKSQNAETYLKMLKRNTETLVKGLTK